jgi:cephalosporin hydroxylase
MASEYRGFGDVVSLEPEGGGTSLSLPEGAEFEAAVELLVRSLPGTHIHNRVPTYFANAVYKVLLPLMKELGPGQLERCDPWSRMVLDTFRFLLARRQKGRYVDYFSRRAFQGREVPQPLMAMSQGVPHCLHWRGVPLFKTVFDAALYPMLLQELRPQTIFETGTANGGSALWLGDLMQTFQIDGHIYTIDLRRPDCTHDRVTFLEGDCGRIAEVLPPALLETAPHPWLFIEDAHAHVEVVLEHMHRFAMKGDYFVIEDTDLGRTLVRHTSSMGDRFTFENDKLKGVEGFARRHRDEYQVDTHYTDFFGYNATCSVDTFWVRVR